MRSPLGLSVVFFLVSSLLLGCGRSTKPTVGFVSNNNATFWSIAEIGAQEGAKKFDVEVFVRKPQQGTVEVQKQEMDALLAKGVQALAVSVIDKENQIPYLNSAAKKLHLITQDNDAPKSDRLCYIGTDNYEAGKAVGEMVKKAMPDGGVVAIFVGSSEAENAIQRNQGVIDALAGEKDAKGPNLGKYKLHGLGSPPAPYIDGANPEKAKQNVDDALAKLQGEKNICLVGLWAYNPPAIYRAVESVNRLGDVKIVGFDEDEATLEGIKKGHIFGTVVQQPYKFGYESVRVMAALVRGDKSVLPANKIMYVPHEEITKDNVVKFHANLNKLLGK